MTIGEKAVIPEALHTSTTKATKTVDYPVALADVTPAGEEEGSEELYVISLNQGIKVVVDGKPMPGLYDAETNKVVKVSSTYKSPSPRRRPMPLNPSPLRRTKRMRPARLSSLI